MQALCPKQPMHLTAAAKSAAKHMVIALIALVLVASRGSWSCHAKLSQHNSSTFSLTSARDAHSYSSWALYTPSEYRLALVMPLTPVRFAPPRACCALRPTATSWSFHHLVYFLA